MSRQWSDGGPRTAAREVLQPGQVLNGQARRQVGYGGEVVLRHPNGDTRTIRVAPLPSDQRFKVRRDGTIAELRRNDVRATGEVRQFAQEARIAYAETQHRDQMRRALHRLDKPERLIEAFKGPHIVGRLSVRDHELVRNAVVSVTSPFGGSNWSEQPFSGDSKELRRIWETGDTFLLAQTLKQHDAYVKLEEEEGLDDFLRSRRQSYEETAYGTDAEWWESTAGRDALSEALATETVPLAVQENLRADVSQILLFDETNLRGGFSGEMMDFALNLVRDDAPIAELDGGIADIPDLVRAAFISGRTHNAGRDLFATKSAREELEALATDGCDRLDGVFDAHEGASASKVLAELYVTMNEPYLTGDARTAAVEALDTKYSLVERRDAHRQLEMYRERLQQMREGIESGNKYVILTAAALGCVSSPAPSELSKTGKLVREHALRIALIRETRTASVIESGVVSSALSASAPPKRDPELHRLLSQGYKVVSSENGVRQNEPTSNRDQAQKSSQQQGSQQQQQGSQQQNSGPQGGQRSGGQQGSSQQGSDQQSGPQSGGQQSSGQQGSSQQSGQQSGGQQSGGQQSGGQQSGGQQGSSQQGGQQSGAQQSGEQQDWSDDESSSSQGSERAQSSNDQQQRSESSQPEAGTQQERSQSTEQGSRNGSVDSNAGESGAEAAPTAGEKGVSENASSAEKTSQQVAPDSESRSEKSGQEADASKQGADAQNASTKEQGPTPSEKSTQQAEAASASENATARTEQGTEGAKPSPRDAATAASDAKNGDAVDGAQKNDADAQRPEKQAGEQRESRTEKQGGEKTERSAPQTAQRRSTDEGASQRPASSSRQETTSRSAAPSGEATTRPEELTSLDDGQSQKRTRGERGGRKHRTAEERQADRRAEQAREARQSSGANTVGSSGEGQGTRRNVRGERSADASNTSYAAQKAAKLLSEIESTKTNRTKTRSGTEVDKEELVEALSTGTDPRPALNSPRERGRLSVVLSPDNSPSTAAWSRTANDFAQVLSSMPNTDATVIPNSNGEWNIERGDAGNHTAMSQRMQDADVLLYMGDKDGEQSVKQLAADGHTVIALNGNTTSSSSGDTEPYVEYVERTPRGGAVYWVSGVPVDNPDKWTAAMGKVLQMLRS